MIGKIFVLCSVMVAACAADQGNVAEHRQPATGNPAVWMTGVWDCATNYDDLGTHFVRHSSTGVYTFTEGGIFQGRNVVFGEYVEIPTDPRFAPLNFAETYSIGNSGSPAQDAPAEQDVVLSDGSAITATGTARGDNGATIIGVTNFNGVITFDDGEVRGWNGGTIGTITAAGIKRFSLNRRANLQPGVNPQVQRVYMSSSCTERATP